jgi:hypothetical protein
LAVSAEGEVLEPGVFVGAGVGVLDELGRGDGLLAGVGFAAGFLIATPLFQINLLPCLMQVYLIFETVFVDPDFKHLLPEIDAEKVGVFEKNKVEATNRVANLLIVAICIK